MKAKSPGNSKPVHPLRFARNTYGLLVRWGGPVVLSLVLLGFRLIWGLQFFTHGKPKLLHIENTIGAFQKLGIPAPTVNAWLVGIVETFGGLLLAAGFGSRFVAAALTINMTVAYLTAHYADVAPLIFEGKMVPFSMAPPFWFLVTSLMVLGLGPGMFSVDGVLKRLVFRRRRGEKVLTL